VKRVGVVAKPGAAEARAPVQELLEWLRAHDGDVPVIMVTAMHDLSTALEAIRRGAYDYILKPFEKDQLFLSVNTVRKHVQSILSKLGAHSKLEAVAIAVREGIMELGDNGHGAPSRR